MENKTVKTLLTLLENKKGQDIVSIDVRNLAVFTEYIIICTVGSSAQMNAVLKELKKNCQVKPDHIEGDAGSEWVLLDYGYILINLFLPDTREFYRLERLWTDS